MDCLALLATGLMTFASTDPITISPAIYSKMPFHPHEDYLAVNIDDGAVKKVQKQIEAKIGRKLRSRKQSHITVLTKPEYLRLIKIVPKERLEFITSSHDIQNTEFRILGLGRGSKDGKATYFLVVRADSLIKIRDEVAKEFYARGGSIADFDPGDFHPHITVAFTDHDLHAQDGVVKDESSLVPGWRLRYR